MYATLLWATDGSAEADPALAGADVRHQDRRLYFGRACRIVASLPG
jgi:hypothetical protein